MGIVARQGFYNSIAGYAGIVIGYVNTVLLFPYILDADQFGLTRMLVAVAGIMSQFSELGTTNITIRFFPFFKNPEKKHFGFFFFVLLIPLIGFLLLSVLVLLFKEQVIAFYEESSALFVHNFNYIFFLTFFMVFFNVIEAYLRSLYKTVFAYTMKNVVLRLLWLGTILIYYFGYIDFGAFVFWFVNVHGLLLLLLVAYLVRQGKLGLLPDFSVLNKSKLAEISRYGLYAILGNSSTFLANRIDILMIGGLLVEGLENVAVYFLAFSIGSVIAVPFNAMGSLLSAMVSNAAQKDDLFELNRIYKKTSSTQFAIGALIFLGIWVNIDNVFALLPEEYAGGKYVVFFIALAKLVHGLSGVNGMIIQFSQHYRFVLAANILFVIFTVLSNFILIPLYGIEGAACATSFSIILHNLIKSGYLWVKVRLFPFTLKTLLTLGIIILTYSVLWFIPHIEGLIYDIVLRSVLVVSVYVPLVYFTKASPEINAIINRILKLAGIKKY